MVETERGRRIAILIGTNKYSKMEKLEFAESDAREMAKILLDPDICGFDEVIQLIDKGKEEVSQTIEKVFKNAKQNDEVLIYYSGHGQPSYKFDLCLLFKDTDPESLLATSLKFDYINECKEQSACKRLVIILDCCYSGTAGMRGNYLEEMLSTYSGSGTVLLTSTGETGSNIAKEDRELKHGVFTGYLLKGLKDWDADDNDDGIITVDDLYRYTFNQTKAKGLQRPQKKGSYEGEMILGRNIPKIKHKEFDEKNEKLMKYLSSAPPDVLYRSLTVLQKMYENPSALNPMELNIKPHLESLLDSKIEVENYIKIVKYQEKIQKQKGKEIKQEEIEKREKEEQDELRKQAEEELQKEEREKKEREKKEREEKEKEEKRIEAVKVKEAEGKEKKAREDEKRALREQEEQEKLREQEEEADKMKLEETKKIHIPSPPPEKHRGSSTKKMIFLAILLILVAALVYVILIEKPELAVNPEPSFEFDLTKGESKSEEFIISNEGRGNLEWTVSANKEWIILNPEGGINSETVDVKIDTESLSPGEYEGIISINSDGESKQFPVKLIVSEPELPILALSPDPHFLNFNLSKGESDSRELQIKNEGGGTLNWNMSEDETWIKLSQESGTDTETVMVTVDTDNLKPGEEYDGKITITSNKSSEECTVHLNVLPSPEDSDKKPELKVGPESSFKFDLTRGESKSEEFIVSNEGGGTLEWTASADKEWLVLNPERGTDTETVTVTIDTADLGPDIYEGNITVNSNAGSETIPVTLAITPPEEETPAEEMTLTEEIPEEDTPILNLYQDPSSFEFELREGEESVLCMLYIHNNGGGDLEWEASSDASWIELDSTGGSVKFSDDPDVVHVTIYASDMKPDVDVYEGSISVDSNDEHKTIPVTLVIKPVSEEGEVTEFEEAAEYEQVTEYEETT